MDTKKTTRFKMTVTAITLTPAQLKVQSDLLTLVNQIESVMIEPLQGRDGNFVSTKLAQASSLIGNTGQIMEMAKKLHDYALGCAAMEIMENDKWSGMKQQLITAYLKGRCYQVSGLYERADLITKGLNTYIMGCTSILKAATAEMNQSRYGQHQ